MWLPAPCTARRAEEQRSALPPRLLLAAHLFRASQSSRPTVNTAQHNRAQTNKKVTPAAPVFFFFFFSFCCQPQKPLQNIPRSPPIVTTTIVTGQTERPPKPFRAVAVTGNAARMGFLSGNARVLLIFLPVFFFFF